MLIIWLLVALISTLVGVSINLGWYVIISSPLGLSVAVYLLAVPAAYYCPAGCTAGVVVLLP